MVNKKKGFTLIEIIASIAIFAIITIATISIMSFCFRYSSINRETYEADTNSKVFMEALKKRENRINEPATGVISVPDGTYVLTMNSSVDNTTVIKNYVGNEFLNGTRVAVVANPETDLAAVISEVKSAHLTDKYAIVVKIKWDSTNKIFDIENWSWDLTKGEISMVNRKSLICPKI